MATAPVLRLTVLEVRDVNRGGGLAVLLQTPGGRTVLYDTGNGYPSAADPSGWDGGYNTGRDTIAPLLHSRGVGALDAVVISHAHYDHYGGFVWLVDHLPIGKLYDAGYEMPGRALDHYGEELAHYARLRARFQARPGAYAAVHASDRLDWDPALEVEVLAPPAEFFHERHPEQRPEHDPPAHYLLNANALMLRIRFGEVVFVLGGDIEAEDQLVSLLPGLAPGQLECDVLVAPAHGIHAVPEFAQAARPAVAIASIFPRWAAGIPAWRVYGDVGATVYCTGVHGHVEVVSDGRSWQVTTQRQAGAW